MLQTLLLSAMPAPLARGVAVKVWEQSVAVISAPQARSPQKSGLRVSQLVRAAHEELGAQTQVLPRRQIACSVHLARTTMSRDRRGKMRAPSALLAHGVQGVGQSLRTSAFLAQLAHINLLSVRPTVLCASVANLASTVQLQGLLLACAAHQGRGPRASSRLLVMYVPEDSGPSPRGRCTALIARLVTAADFASVEPLHESLWRC